MWMPPPPLKKTLCAIMYSILFVWPLTFHDILIEGKIRFEVYQHDGNLEGVEGRCISFPITTMG